MPEITVETSASAADVAAVLAGLLAFNVRHIGDPAEEPVQIFLRTDSGLVAGGLLGHIRWRWVYVAKLWVSDELRGQGYGAALVHAAEARGRERNCIGIHLETFAYQARPFYEKLGYSLFGTLEGYPPAYREFYLSKLLSP